MAISWRTATGLTAAADTATPFASLAYTLPTGHTTNDVLICVAAVRPYTLTVGTPTDYTARGAITSGVNTANGVGVGSSKVAAFTKIHDGSESNPASTMTAGYTPAMTAMLAAYSSYGTAATWTIENTTGVDATVTGTSISATGGSLTWAVGDQIVVVSAGDDNLDTETSVSVTFSGGVTHSGLTEMLTTNVTTTGNDGSLYVYTATIDGAGTGAPTFAATAGVSGTSERGVIFLRINEAVAHTASGADLTQDDIGVTDALTIAQDDAVTDAGVGVTDVNQPVVDKSSGAVAHDRPLSDPMGVTDSRTVALSIVVDTINEQIDVVDTDQPTVQTSGDIPRSKSDSIGITDALSVGQDDAISEAGVGITDVDQPEIVIATNNYDVLIEEDCEFTDSIDLSRNRGFSDTVGITDVGQPAASIDLMTNVSPDDAGVGITDSLHIEFGKYQTETGIQITDVDQPVVVSSAPQSHTRTPGDTINVTDVGQPGISTSLGAYVLIEDGVRVYDTNLNFDTSDEYEDGVGTTDSTTIARSLAISDSVGVTDSRAVDRSLAITESAGLDDDPPAVDKTGGSLWFRTVEGTGEVIGITDADEPTVVHFVPTGFQVPLSDEVSISDQPPDIDQTGLASRSFTEPAGLADYLSFDRSIELNDRAGLADTATPNHDISIGDTVGISDTRTLGLGADPADSTGLSDFGQPDIQLEVLGISLRPVDDDMDITDQISVAISRVLTVEDMLDLIDTQTLSSPNLKLGVSDVVGVIEDVDILGWHPYWRFEGPTIKEAPIGGHWLFHRYKMDRGISVLITDGVATEKRFPTQDELEACDTYYLGGHVYEMEDDEAQVLVAAGYSDHLTMIGIVEVIQ